MKKLLTILLFVLLAFSGFSQRRASIPWLQSQDITNTRYFIYRGDTIDFTSVVDSLYVSFSDSITDYVTPKQLMDSIATLAGGHDPVTAGTSAIAGGIGVTGQELSFSKATSAQSGYLDKDDFTAFYNKLSSVTHGLHFTGMGTGASPLRLDTGYVRSWLNPIYLSPTGDLIGTFFGLDTTYLLNYNNHLNTPTISDVAFGVSWDANSDLATKNSIYDALVSVSGIVTDLTYSPYSDKGIMSSSTGAGDTIPVVDTTYAGLITPTDKARLDGVVSLTLTDGLKSGGNVTWTGGLNFAITPAVYYISLTRYETTHETATLDVADTLNRIDVLALDTLEQVIVIKGTPSANPQKPTIDPQAHIELTNVLLLAGDTIPSQTTGDSIINVIVYDENLEWATSATGVVVDFAYPTSPYKGDSCASVGTIGRGDYLQFTGSDTLNYSDYETVSFWLKLKEAIPANHDLRVELFLDATGLGSAIAAVDKTYLDWQNVVIRIEDFEKIYTKFNELRIYYQVKTGATTAGFYLDDFIVQKGITQPVVTEYQTLSTNDTAGHIEISNGNYITLNVNDADADSTNELQTLSLDGENLVISDGNTIDLGIIIPDSTNYWSKTEITTADTTKWGTLQTATTTSYSNTTSGLAAENVNAAIDEIDNIVDGIISTGGDSWGVDSVNTDITLTGDGTPGDVLKVDTTLIPTYTQMRGEISDSIATISVSGDNWGTDVVNTDATLTGSGTVASPLKVDTAIIGTLVQVRSDISDSIATVTPNATHTGEVTGATSLTISDNVVDYGNVDETLKDSLVNNTLAWDISASGIIYCTPSTGTVSFTNKQKNKTVVVVLTLSSATITWPAEAKILDGSATLGDGTFYVYLHCISNTIITVSITKEAA